MRRVHLVITGRVQGVLFRRYAQTKARELGVTGWAKNALDGDVEMVCEGKEKDIILLISLIRQGPSMAYVKDVKVEDEEHAGEFSDFTIREFGF